MKARENLPAKIPGGDDGMGTLLIELSPEEAKRCLLSSEHYCTLELPSYFEFNQVLKCANEIVNMHNFRRQDGKFRAPDLDDVNYTILSNKDSAYGWRPMHLIHPVLYVELVKLITSPENWEEVQNRFEEFRKDPKIVCLSVPPSSVEKSKEESIASWWRGIEQESIILSLDYNYVAATDIVDCYGSLYTHTISWALNGKECAKANRHKKHNTLGDDIDRKFTAMHNGQTNGIPQGNMLSDLIAEIVLGYADLMLSKRLSVEAGLDFRILRYRDDYRIFAKSKEGIRKVMLELTRVLSELNFRLNSSKTIESSDVITASLKPDKLYWISAVRSHGNLFKTTLIVRDLGLRYPNSGSLVRSLATLRRRVDKLTTRPVSNRAIIAVIVDIMYRSPRTYPHAASIISKLLSFEDGSTASDLCQKIFSRLHDMPNIGFLEIWLQRVMLAYDVKCNYREKLCQIVTSLRDQVEAGDSSLWNSSWLVNRCQDMLNKTYIVDRGAIGQIDKVIPVEETEVFLRGYGHEDDTELFGSLLPANPVDFNQAGSLEWPVNADPWSAMTDPWV
ncbi:Reverse transcriptase (RNA-dependent DNA polymerase) [Actinomyces denticolens]|uniref:Reverse transcriptase (RNA-dependent DNA polymerase) n=1 Tax=Actinomyces denticolens TaxID=52767 RepID=A0ABY1IC16_9ACTO|nr:RNA-directed DNA polymerase [Actinomyces denticolens]SHI81522.1 Reverse transcriptase (RNA-dependent DNA polymerase) [Actinomyces denticolens]